MEVVKIVTTVFNALVMFLTLWVGATSKKKEQLGICIWFMVIFVLNLFCMWG